CLRGVGPSARVEKYAPEAVRHFGGVRRLDTHASLAREVLVSGDAADAKAEPHPGRDLAARLHLDGLEADVVGVFQHRNDAAAIETDVEFARQAVERALVENVEMP